MKKSPPCPCGSQQTHEQCCGRFLAGEQAPDAEALMRSRYTAYTLKKEDYLLDTWHPDTRPSSLNFDQQLGTKWLELHIVEHLQKNPTSATVRFIARYKINGRAQQLIENSQFLRIEGRWYYIDGEITE